MASTAESSSSPRTRPMKVLVLGMVRTGTTSIHSALQILGFNSWHTAEAANDPKWVLEKWDQGLRAKYFGEGKPFGREEFDALLGDYDAITDAPPCLFVDELTTAYPTAKVILTNRNVDSWLASMRATIFEVATWRSYALLAPFDRTFLSPMHAVIRDFTAGFCKGTNPLTSDVVRQSFLDHYAHVRAVVPADNLLEFESKDGWAPLCEFLGVDVPCDKESGEQLEYPFVNDGEFFIQGHLALRNAVAWKAVKTVAGGVLPIVAVGTAVYFYAGRRSL